MFYYCKKRKKTIRTIFTYGVVLHNVQYIVLVNALESRGYNL